MKIKLALVALFVLGLTASLAVAAPASSQKKPTGTTTTATTTTTTTTKNKGKKPACRANVALILRGKLVSVATDGQSFTMSVTRTNAHARSYKGQTVTVQINAKTKILRLGKKVTLANLVVGDNLNVQARACKKTIQTAGTPLAVRVVAKPAK
jgi:heme-binding NEAT domain protein